MRLHVLLIVSAGLLLAADDREDAAKKELENLAGAWDIRNAQYNGKGMSLDRIEGWTLTFSKDQFDLKQIEVIAGACKVDPTQKPKTIDIKVDKGRDKGKTLHGIYELDQNKLKICFNAADKADRPTEFATKAGSGSTLYIFQRPD